MPFGQVPVLEFDGKLLSQSYAIARYIARQHGLAGQGDWEQAQVDMYADCIKDFMISNQQLLPSFRLLAS
jgi:glutathione S-transferase